jgi:hypothetical protein
MQGAGAPARRARGDIVMQVLQNARQWAEGAEFTPGEDALRAVRVLAVLQLPLPLRHFPLELLRSAPGWDAAFARTISDLEAALLRPEDLDVSDAQIADIALVWRALDESAGTS